MRKLLAGPWLGEFGWELFLWQGMLRHMASREQFARVTIALRPGHEVLYDDFADDYVRCTAGYETDGWRLNGLTPILPRELLDAYSDQDTLYVRPGPHLQAEQRFIRYGTFDPRARFDIVMHARATAKSGSDRRNWPLEKWHQLVAALSAHRIAFVGVRESAACVEAPNTVDLRGLPLEALVDVFASSRLALGGSSGPMHMASLCGCPHLVWTDRAIWPTVGDTNRARYERIWNPFRTRVGVIDDHDWDPPVGRVTREVEAFIRDGVFEQTDVRCASQDVLQVGAWPAAPVVRLPPAAARAKNGPPRRRRIFFLGVFNGRSTNPSQAAAFRRLGCEVVEYPYRVRAREIGAVARDREIVAVCERERPDLVFFSKCNSVAADVVELCNRHAATCLWYMDPLASFDEELREKVRRCTFTCCGREGPFKAARQVSSRVYFICEGYDEESNFPVEVPFRYDVSFIGDLRGERASYHRTLGFHVYTNAYGMAHSKAVCETRISLNFTTGDGTSDRTYKVLASRGFLLTQPWDGMERLFTPGRDLDVFSDVNELRSKIDFYLTNLDRARGIAEHGNLTVKQYSRRSFAERVLAVLNEGRHDVPV